MKKANSKKEVHKATYKPIYIKAIYTAVVALSLLLLIPFIYPVPIYVPFIGPALNKIVQEGNIGTITFTKPLNPDTRHYITLTLTATNKGNVEFPKGIASIIWKDKNYDPLYREKFEIYIDGISHNYYVPIGENLYWNKTKNVTQVKLELPHVEGIDITIESFSVNKRVLFPLDTYLNLYLKKYLDIDYINRFLTPSYLIFIFILVSYFIYSIYFKRVSFKALFKRALFKREASPKREDKRVGEGKENKINLKNLKINPIGISAVLLLLLFSFYFLSSQYYTLRAYYYSYKNYLKEGKLQDTYLGFYDFEKFLTWLNRRLPQDENIIVLLKGQSVYIMSEMAYNLYPRDVKFINISGKKKPVTLYEIKAINEKYNNKYKYVVILSEKDKIESNRLSLVDSYRDSGGFIYYYECCAK